MSDKEWFIGQYDRFVEGEHDNVVLEKARDALGHRYADAIESGSFVRPTSTLLDEGRLLFDRFVKPERSRRRESLRVAGRAIVDSLFDGGGDDPQLGLAYPIGDGTDKTLLYWSDEDWRTSLTERYRNAGAATASAVEFDTEIASPIISAIQGRGAHFTGDLFEARDDG